MRAIVLALGIFAAAQPGVPRYEVYAVRFAHVPYAEASLVAGVAKGPQVDIAFTVWPIVDPSSQRVILVDAGFYRDKFMASWKPQDYVRPSVALQNGLNIPPDRVRISSSRTLIGITSTAPTCFPRRRSGYRRTSSTTTSIRPARCGIAAVSTRKTRRCSRGSRPKAA